MTGRYDLFADFRFSLRRPVVARFHSVRSDGSPVGSRFTRNLLRPPLPGGRFSFFRHGISFVCRARTDTAPSFPARHPAIMILM